MNQRIADAGQQAAKLHEVFSQQQAEKLVQLGQKMSATFAAGGQLLVAADGALQPLGQLMASCFTYRLGFDRPVLPAIALGSDPVLAAAMTHQGQQEQHLVRHYRAIGSPQHLLLILSDGADMGALRAVRDEALDQDQPVVMLSATGENDPLCRDGVGICVDLGTDSPARQQELLLFSGHLLCELVEAELFGV